MRPLFNVLSFAAFLAAALPANAQDEAALLPLLKSGGQVVLMRHTTTMPGVGDPPGMSLSDCATQRNLTDEGRAEARAIGERLKGAGIAFDTVVASPLCRCKDTAQLAFGRVDDVLPGTTRGEREVREMRAFASEKRRGNAVLVSHGTTIHNALGIETAPGEMVVVTAFGEGRYEIRGKLRLLATQ